MNQKIALVLGSGGARGIAHIGVIRELIKNGFEITSIAGSSMGALVGGVYACGKLDEYEAWMSSLSKMDVFNLVDFTLSTSGIIKADKVFKEIHKLIPDQQIEDLPVKFAAVATDLHHCKEIVITQGSLFDAIRASISIPLIITPVQKSDTLFVDGGVLNPVPVNRVFRQEGDILVAVNVNAQIPYQPTETVNPDWHFLEKINSSKLKEFQEKLSNLFPPSKKEKTGYFNLISETSILMLSHILKLTLEMNPPDLLIEISRNACGTFDFYKATELIELGKQATITALEKFKIEKSDGV
jgi:NTE family protein